MVAAGQGLGRREWEIWEGRVPVGRTWGAMEDGKGEKE